jgi:LPS-assembly protein
VVILACYFLVAANKIDSSYTVSAETTEYDSNVDKVILKGKVEIFKDDYILKADKVIYDKAAEKAFAHGNVSLITPTGEEVYADILEIDNNLKEAVAHSLSARLNKDEKFIAKYAHHYYPGKTTFTDVVYTPCPVCKEKNPQWQIHSKKINYEKKKDVSYWHNFFEIYGVPVAYFPYLRTAAPDAEPRSGFLIPSNHKYRDVYGYGIAIPYYYRINDTQDLVYSPIVTTKQGILHRAEYRHLMRNGHFNFNAQYIHPKKLWGGPANRYYVKGNAKYDLNKYWWLEGQLEGVSDKSYLPNYWDRSENYLTSNANLNYVNNRDYGYLKSYYFQGLREGNRDADEIPVVLPIVQYHKETFDDNSNKYLVDFNALHLFRKKGTDVRRGSFILGWHKTYFWENNEIGVLRNFRSDIYNFENKAATEGILDSKKTVYRIFPELELTWKYPLMKIEEKYSLLLEPMINVIFSPNSSSNREISVNEDSQAIEIEDSNLFSNNRYSGFDYVEHGIRANYGLATTLITDNMGEYNLLFGQSYMVRKNDIYPINSGLKNKHFSDYVGRISTRPFKFLEVYYKTRLDSENCTLRRGELGTTVNVNTGYDTITNVEVGVKFANYNLLAEETDVKKSLNFSGKLYIFKKWYIGGEVIRNFTINDSFNVHTKANVGYVGECSNFKISAMRKDTVDPRRNIYPTRGITLDWEIHLKNIN